MTLTDTIEELYKALDAGEDVLNVLADALVDVGLLRSADELTRYDAAAWMMWGEGRQVPTWWNAGEACNMVADIAVVPVDVFRRLGGNCEDYAAMVWKTYPSLSAAYKALVEALRG